MAVPVSKLAYNITVSIPLDDLKHAFAKHGAALTSEGMFRARHELKYEIDRHLNQRIADVAAKMIEEGTNA